MVRNKNCWIFIWNFCSFPLKTNTDTIYKDQHHGFAFASLDRPLPILELKLISWNKNIKVRKFLSIEIIDRYFFDKQKVQLAPEKYQKSIKSLVNKEKFCVMKMFLFFHLIGMYCVLWPNNINAGTFIKVKLTID